MKNPKADELSNRIENDLNILTDIAEEFMRIREEIVSNKGPMNPLRRALFLEIRGKLAAEL